MADLQSPEVEHPKLSPDDLPIVSSDELMKKQLVFGGIILLVALVCVSIVRSGSIH